ncbi:MAG: glycosyltransferase [Bacteroidota bacterium]
MKIIQLLQRPQLRGAEIFASQLSAELLKMGHDCDMLILFDGQDTAKFEGRVSRLNRPLSKRFYDLAGWKQLNQLIREEKPDIVQANAADTLKFSAFSKFIYGWKTPIVFRNANKISDFVNSYSKKVFNQFLINRCHGVASVSELCRHDFLETFQFQEERTKTLPVGVNMDYEQYELPEDLKELKGEGPLLVNVASLVPEKNHIALLEIFAELKKSFLTAKLFILGDGRLKLVLQKHIKSIGLEGEVYLLGYRKDVLPIVQNADLFMLPSLIEGLPGVILESFMMKTPVVANNVGGISEVVKDDLTGRLIEPDDIEGFIDSCKSLLTKPEYAQKLVWQAYDLVNSEYLNSIIAKRFERFYQQLTISRS